MSTNSARLRFPVQPEAFLCAATHEALRREQFEGMDRLCRQSGGQESVCEMCLQSPKRVGRWKEEGVQRQPGPIGTVHPLARASFRYIQHAECGSNASGTLFVAEAATINQARARELLALCPSDAS